MDGVDQSKQDVAYLRSRHLQYNRNFTSSSGFSSAKFVDQFLPGPSDQFLEPSEDPTENHLSFTLLMNSGHLAVT